MLLNNSTEKPRCHSKRFLNDEVQCQHACAHADRCGLQQTSGGATVNTRSCNDLGLCQNRTPPCAGCKPNPAHYFAPGTISSGGSSDLQLDNNRWVFALTWREYVAVTVLVAIVMGTAGWLK